MKYSVLVALPILAATPALADDNFVWSGPYIGVLGGSTTSYFDLNNTSTAKQANLSLGAEAGANWQFGQLVLGVEADFSGTNSGALKLASSGKDTYSAQQDWLATARGRFGVSFDKALIYGTGGLAVSQFPVSDLPFLSVSSRPIGNDVKLGGVFGLGAEYALNKTISLKLEYLHTDFGSFINPNFTKDSVRLSDDSVRFGVNWHF